MPRYIDADEVLDHMRSAMDMQDLYLPTHFIDLVISQMPTADVQELKHGQWIKCDYKELEHGFVETYHNRGYCCSVCRTGFDKRKMTYKQFCPRCGAIMDGGTNDESIT